MKHFLDHMNLAIIGYGKMGHIIERLALEYGFDVKLRLDIDNNANFEGFTGIEFPGYRRGGGILHSGYRA